MKKVIFPVMVVALFATQAMAGVRLAGYYDTREQENTSTTIYSSLPHGFGLWGFVDFWTVRADSDLDIDDEADFVSFYGEANVNYALSKNWQLMLELNDGSAVPANLRPGLRYWIPLENGKVGIKVLPYKFELVDLDPMPDPSGQVGIAWRLNFFENKMFFEGFADVNWKWEKQEDFYPFITEPQLGINLTKNTALLVEYRYAALNPVTRVADEGWGLGFEYRLQ
jgi:hypothetical protein